MSINLKNAFECTGVGMALESTLVALLCDRRPLWPHIAIRKKTKFSRSTVFKKQPGPDERIIRVDCTPDRSLIGNFLLPLSYKGI